MFPKSTYYGLSSKNGLTVREANNYKKLFDRPLPLDKHQELAQIIREGTDPIKSNKKTGPHHWLSQVRCVLDDIVQCEYPTEEAMSTAFFSTLYYGNPAERSFNRDADPKAALQKVADVIAMHATYCPTRFRKDDISSPGMDPRYGALWQFILRKLKV